ncbi:cytochrome P450 4C1-like [Colias croceus]|uniref:cytochrome P450 4C1-like n=1 Tax=Colias crocea TaxID=72248 RepID=UPI001E27A25C|nr:cytochrome P450 4C1-like [Colias croceus]
MQLLKPVFGDAAFIAPVPEWSRRRKVLVPAFSPKVLNSFVDIISKRSQDIVHQISSENLVGCGQFSIFPYISQYTLRTVTETTLGIDLDTTGNQLSEYLHAMSQIFRLATERIIQNKYKSLENYDRSAYNEQTIFGMDKNCQLKSFLDHLILISGNEGGFALKDIREDLLVLLLAGTDTSAVAICNTLKLLAKYPKIQEKVYAELEEVFGDSDRLLVKDDLKNIKYLDRVLKESLRLFPPVPVIVRSVTQETTLPSGVILPENAGVIVIIWGANRDPKVWGPDADCFDPDRYLKGTTPKIMSFSSGPRNCVGYQYAMLSIKISLIAILRHYKVVGEEESGPVPEIDCEFAVMMKAKDGYKVQFERRNK